MFDWVIHRPLKILKFSIIAIVTTRSVSCFHIGTKAWQANMNITLVFYEFKAVAHVSLCLEN